MWAYTYTYIHIYTWPYEHMYIYECMHAYHLQANTTLPWSMKTKETKLSKKLENTYTVRSTIYISLNHFFSLCEVKWKDERGRKGRKNISALTKLSIAPWVLCKIVVLDKTWDASSWEACTNQKDIGELYFMFLKHFWSFFQIKNTQANCVCEGEVRWDHRPGIRWKWKGKRGVAHIGYPKSTRLKCKRTLGTNQSQGNI